MASTSSAPATPYGNSVPSPPQSPHLTAIDDRIGHLRGQLSQVAADKESVSSQLRLARKETQRTDAALRAEIDALRRTVEKSAPAEQRSRQKVLALQEAVKQALSATKDTEAHADSLESQVPGLNDCIHEAEEEHETAQRDASKSKKDTDEALRLNRKKVGDLRNELSVWGNRFEKLNGKKEKLASEAIPKLEEELARLAAEIELVESDSKTPDYHWNAAAGSRPWHKPPAPIGSQRPGPTTPTSTASNSTGSSQLSSLAPPFEPTSRRGRLSFSSRDGPPIPLNEGNN